MRSSLTPSALAQLNTDDGHKLHLEWFPANAPIGTVLMMHGYAEHIARYREVAAVLVEAGYHVAGFDFRGHGRSSGHRGLVHAFDNYVSDIKAAVAWTSDHAGTTPASLIWLAHSNGALAALYAMVSGNVPSAAILSSPFLALRLQVPLLKRWAGLVASRIAPALSLPAQLDVKALTSDPAKQAERTNDALCFNSATARWFTESERAQAAVAKHASSLVLPTCWLIAGDDQIADAHVAKGIAARVPNAHIVDYPDFQHEVFNERGRERCYQEVTKWLAALPPLTK